MIEKIVGRHDADQRLDRWLRKAFPLASLSSLFAVIRKKKIRVNGKPGKGTETVNAGDVICIYENIPEAPANMYEKKAVVQVDSRIVIVSRTADYLVLDKPAGLASQPGTNQQPGDSLIELVWNWAEYEGLDFKPALVHRLDQETSGLIIAGLTGEAVRTFNALIRAHKVRKEYVALVNGYLEEPKGTIRLALERTDSAQGAKMEAGQGKDSVTHYQVIRQVGNCSLVRITLETGRMHQIRAHFAAIGHALIGDGRYGDFALNREFRKSHGLKRLFLHSALLDFQWKGKRIQIERELPAELQKVLTD
jgi:23S rRNA pseudouridine955/2504/2580 synthase